MSDDIIEVGEDGAFNIPSPTKPAPQETKMIEPTEQEIERALAEVRSKNIYESMSPGDYKIFTDKSSILLFIKLAADETAQKIHLSDSKDLKVITSANKLYTVSLPKDFSYAKDAIVPKNFKDFLTVTIACN
jgi:hypothetical protein